MSTTDRLPKFWSCNDLQERLIATTIEEAIEEWLDDRDDLSPPPEVVTVYGYAPMEVLSVERLADWALDHVLECLDEEHGDPDGDFAKPTEEMKAAALAFARIVRAEYKPWSCEQVTSRIVRVADHITPERVP